MHAPSIIEKKRDGGSLSRDEIAGFIQGYTIGTIPDYQMSALAMAIYFNGMSDEETAWLTAAMLESGDRFHFSDGAPRVVDKHSTGGIGDKVSLALAPLLACDDLWVPMISGRGLGITGGTLDKLESIPGVRVRITTENAMAQLESIGVVMMGQTDEICPADRKLYSLRDVTATVPSQPLIVASIMSKKLAESLDALVLDVKFGSGAFMKTRAEAESLAGRLELVGRAMDVETVSVLNPMEEPLGLTVGNALEVGEALETLSGKGPPDLREIVVDLASRVSRADRSRLEGWLDDGSALKKFAEMVEAQGGDPACFDDYERVHVAGHIEEVRADRSGVVSTVDAGEIGRTCLALGGGRSRSDEEIDPSVGFDRLVKVGTSISAGDMIGRVHARDASSAETAAARLETAVRIEA